MKLPQLSARDHNINQKGDVIPSNNDTMLDSSKPLLERKSIVEAVMAEIKQGFDVKMQSLPKIALTFENLSVWAKVKLSKGFCKSGKSDFVVGIFLEHS